MTIDFNAVNKITTPFAELGDAADILDTAGTGRMSWNYGSPVETEVDSPPFRIDYNGVLKRISQACISFFAGKHYKFDSAFSTAVGGYPLGAIIQRNDNNRLFLSTIDNNTNNPNSVMTGWLLVGDGGNADTLDGLHADAFALAGNIPAVIGTYSNLTISTGGADNIINISYDEMIVKAGTSARVLQNSVLVCNAGLSGIGGLDTGSRTVDTWYALYVIFNPTTNVVDTLLSLTYPAPTTLPSGFTHFARVGWIRTDSTANKYPLGIIQHGKKVSYRVIAGSNTPSLPVLVSGATGTFDFFAPTWASVSVSALLPPTAIAISGTAIGSSDLTGVLSSYVMVAPNTSYGSGQSLNPPPVSNFVWDSGTWGSVILVNTAFTLFLEAPSLAIVIANATGAVRVMGWEDC